MAVPVERQASAVRPAPLRVHLAVPVVVAAVVPAALVLLDQAVRVVLRAEAAEAAVPVAPATEAAVDQEHAAKSALRRSDESPHALGDVRAAFGLHRARGR